MTLMHSVQVWGACIRMSLLVLQTAANVQGQLVLTVKSSCSKNEPNDSTLKKALNMHDPIQ